MEKNKRAAAASTATCTDQATFGAPPDVFPTAVNHVGLHKDVMGMWFVAKATGSIDTIFWNTLSSVGAKDSTLFIRVHRSVLGVTAGPGIRPGPYNPPCQNWGYWANTNDPDQGVAAFPEDATDTTWVSTYNGLVNSFTPFSNSLWGLTGYPVIDHLGINSVAMMEIGIPLNVTIGDQFFVSMRVNGPAGHPAYEEDWTSWATASFRVDPSDEYYPSRNWKFYEHDSGPSNCAGVPVNLVKRGWVARGGFGDANDSLDVGLLNWWYTMSVLSNIPPVVQSMTQLSNTFETEDHLIEAVITDCNPENEDLAGVASAILRWQTTPQGATIPVLQPDIPMANVGGDNWEAILPGKPPGTTVSYKVIATDSNATTANGPPVTFRIVQLSNGYYYADTSAVACSPKSIAATGTVMPKSAFYLPPNPGANAAGPDDGTYGPINLGGDMLLFGSPRRYAWVSVNGALALSVGNSDTIDVNSEGLYSIFWSLPEQPLRQGGRSDTSGSARIPNGFIAPLWADMWYGDSVTTCGAIRYQLGYGGDTCIVIVEWDSIGTFADLGGSTCDNTTFRAILNKCDGTIEFQYDDVGGLGLDSSAVIGMQDSNAVTSPKAGFIFVNEYTFPYETKPRSGWCITFYPATIVNALSGWNLLSVGVTPFGGYAASNVFPGTVAPVYAYAGSYTPVTTTTNGPGYWAKFPAGTAVVGGRGGLKDAVAATVVTGWNLVGAAGWATLTSAVVETPPDIVTTNYFDYGSGGYGIATALVPGKGHWVKTNAGGTLGISGSNAPGKRGPSTNLDELTTITVTDAAGRRQTLYIGSDARVAEALSFYEMPPAAPDFDARYVSGRMLETYPAAPDARAVYEYPLAFEGAYPIAIAWNVQDKNRQFVLMTGSDNTVMNGVGHATIQEPDIKGAIIRVTEAGAIPKEFALGQNYPNPFNPSTRFEIQVAKPGLVSLKIYDLLGRMVADLVSETKEPGIYSVTWDADNFPTGVYFAKMTAGDFTASRKLLLMK